MFYSILFPTREQHSEPRQTDAPDCFKDLNLDQIFAPILKAKKEFKLESFFFTALHDPEVILYRQDVMRELESDELRALFAGFSKTVYDLGRYMDTIRKALTSNDSWNNNYLTRGHMLDYAERYCLTVSALSEGLSKLALRSAGLRGFAEYLQAYCASESCAGLCAHVKRLRDELSTIEYCMLIKNGTIHVRKYEGQPDHSRQILAVFEKFRQGDVKNYRQKLPEEPYAAHVEAAVLKMLADLYPDIFADLNSFCSNYFHFDDETILRFSREIQFYLSWLDSVCPLRQTGLPFNYPKLCNTPEHLYDLDGFDLALAAVTREKTVTNDFVLNAPEHIMVITGPNQGGKTTFARAFGQVHYARVSTDSEEQLTSYEAQVDYYTKYIQGRPDWEFIEVYTDEGISALNTKKREGFNRMIADALAGKIDLIVTKSVSRFARNTVDSLTTVRQLKEKGIEVYFEKENIWTLDSKGELLITIMSSLAQEESRSISENVTWGQRKRFADGKVSIPYGQFLSQRRGRSAGNRSGRSQNSTGYLPDVPGRYVHQCHRQTADGARYPHTEWQNKVDASDH